MAVNDLTLDEMFALEREHSPFVGGRTGEFLKPSERANAKPRPGKLYNGVLTKNPAPAGIPQRKVVHKPHLRSIVLSKSQIVASIAEKTEISKKQATEILDHIAQLAYKHAKDTFTVPGIGKLVLRDVPSHQITMQFGPKKGLLIRVPAKRVVKFRVAKAAKNAILKK